MLDKNRYNLERLHTHSFPLDEAEWAIFTLAGENAGEEVIRVSLNI